MSFEKPVVNGAISRYYSTKQSYAAEPSAALVGWLIDYLEANLPSIKDVGGDVPITYSWFYSQQPQENIVFPYVAISAYFAERESIGTLMEGVNKSPVVSMLVDVYMDVVIVAQSVKLREDIESAVYRTLFRAVYAGKTDTPLAYFEKVDFGDSRAFSTVDRYITTTMWQNLTENAYYKVVSFMGGFYFAMPETGTDDFALIGLADLGMNTDTINVGGSGHRIALRVLFTPNNT